MFNMESRHLLRALDCFSENFNLKNFPGGACALKSAPLIVLMGTMVPILPLCTISLGPIYPPSARVGR